MNHNGIGSFPLLAPSVELDDHTTGTHREKVETTEEYEDESFYYSNSDIRLYTPIETLFVIEILAPFLPPLPFIL